MHENIIIKEVNDIFNELDITTKHEIINFLEIKTTQSSTYFWAKMSQLFKDKKNIISKIKKIIKNKLGIKTTNLKSQKDDYEKAIKIIQFSQSVNNEEYFLDVNESIKTIILILYCYITKRHQIDRDTLEKHIVENINTAAKYLITLSKPELIKDDRMPKIIVRNNQEDFILEKAPLKEYLNHMGTSKLNSLSDYLNGLRSSVFDFWQFDEYLQSIYLVLTTKPSALTRFYGLFFSKEDQLTKVFRLVVSIIFILLAIYVFNMLLSASCILPIISPFLLNTIQSIPYLALSRQFSVTLLFIFYIAIEAYTISQIYKIFDDLLLCVMPRRYSGEVFNDHSSSICKSAIIERVRARGKPDNEQTRACILAINEHINQAKMR